MITDKKAYNSAWMREHRKANHEQYLERERRNKANVPLDIRRARAFKYNIWYAYELRIEDYNALLEKQGYACAICKRPFGDAKSRIDHDHNTGKVRGILCHPCNQGMIGVDASPLFCEAALRYKGGY